MDPRFGFRMRLFAGALASRLTERFDELFNSLVLLPQLVGVAGDFVLGQLVGQLPDLLPLLPHRRLQLPHLLGKSCNLRLRLPIQALTTLVRFRDSALKLSHLLLKRLALLLGLTALLVLGIDLLSAAIELPAELGDLGLASTELILQ